MKSLLTFLQIVEILIRFLKWAMAHYQITAGVFLLVNVLIPSARDSLFNVLLVVLIFGGTLQKQKKKDFRQVSNSNYFKVDSIGAIKIDQSENSFKKPD